jgi:protein-S-isoprenylcysteine O-methyltransferase Ste14
MKQPKERTRVQAPVLALGLIALAFVLGMLRPLLIAAASVRTGGFVLTIFGFLLGLGAYVAFRNTRDPQRRGPHLVTTGVYRVSRNPIALGFLLMLVGLPLNSGSAWGLLLAPLMVVLFKWYVIDPEEKDLANRFGEEYKNYQARVRRWI